MHSYLWVFPRKVVLCFVSVAGCTAQATSLTCDHASNSSGADNNSSLDCHGFEVRVRGGCDCCLFCVGTWYSWCMVVQRVLV